MPLRTPLTQRPDRRDHHRAKRATPQPGLAQLRGHRQGPRQRSAITSSTCSARKRSTLGKRLLEQGARRAHARRLRETAGRADRGAGPANSGLRSRDELFAEDRPRRNRVAALFVARGCCRHGDAGERRAGRSAQPLADRAAPRASVVSFAQMLPPDPGRPDPRLSQRRARHRDPPRRLQQRRRLPQAIRTSGSTWNGRRHIDADFAAEITARCRQQARRAGHASPPPLPAPTPTSTTCRCVGAGRQRHHACILLLNVQ
ncbi:MAG: hypothetical protein MZV65_36355 [Chromatiales bacterium]|nr:hypothetical protein [Chromatiales bacterium]